jgi:hypothetical protein
VASTYQEGALKGLHTWLACLWQKHTEGLSVAVEPEIVSDQVLSAIMSSDMFCQAADESHTYRRYSRMSSLTMRFSFEGPGLVKA